jgi:hypothetical protein
MNLKRHFVGIGLNRVLELLDFYVLAIIDLNIFDYQWVLELILHVYRYLLNLPKQYIIK